MTNSDDLIVTARGDSTTTTLNNSNAAITSNGIHHSASDGSLTSDNTKLISTLKQQQQHQIAILPSTEANNLPTTSNGISSATTSNNNNHITTTGIINGTTATGISSDSATTATSNNTGIHHQQSQSSKRMIPEECLQQGLWEVELVYYTLGHRSIPNGLGNGDNRKQRRGKVYKCLADSEYKCFESHDGTVYWPGDYVYVETSPTEPYMIGSICNFRPAKREQVSFKINRYYRCDDIPEVTHSLLIQERKEHGIYDKTIEYEPRELFQSDVPSQAFSVSYLRGKCIVKNYRNINDLIESPYLISDKDTFFSCLSFNLENNRLAALHLTSRTGPRFEADLPDWQATSVSEEPDRDQLLYRPGDICEDAEFEYIKQCRTYRTFLFQSNPRITALERDSRLGDLVMDDAIVTLHNCGYNIEKARDIMKQQDALLAKDSLFLTQEDAKKFSKGIKAHGKNFPKIRKEFLPSHMREHLVKFYYMWKKSRDAVPPRALHRTRLMPKKVIKNGQPPRAQSCDFIDYASASESELDEIQERACHHCYDTKSRDWHHAGSNRQLMCTECRLHYKKYGILRPVERPATVPLCLSRASPTDEMGVRTRANGKHRRKMSKGGRGIDSPAGDDKQSRKSRKRIHRHSAMSDDVLENASSPRTAPPTPIMNGTSGEKSRQTSEPKDIEMNGKASNEYQSSSSTVSSPSPKAEAVKEEESDLPPAEKKIKQEPPPELKPAIEALPQQQPMEVEVKEEKENFPVVVIKEEIDEGEEAVLSLEQQKSLKEMHEKDLDHQCSVIVKTEKSEHIKRDEDMIFQNDAIRHLLEPVTLERIVQRDSGNSCARRDLIYRIELNPHWIERKKIVEAKKKRDADAKKAKEEAERNKREAQAAQEAAAKAIQHYHQHPPLLSTPQPKTSMDMNGFSGIDINALQRIQSGAIPPMPMMPPQMDPRLMMQHHQAAQQQAHIMAMIEQHQKMQQQHIQQQQQQQQQAAAEAQRLAQQQKQQQEQQQRQQQAAQAQQQQQAAAEAQRLAQQQQQQQHQQQQQQQQQLNAMQQKQQQQQHPGMPPVSGMVTPHPIQMMMNPMLAGNPAHLNLMASLMQSQQAQAFQAQLQAHAQAEMESQRKRMEHELQQRFAAAAQAQQRAQADALHQQQQQQNQQQQHQQHQQNQQQQNQQQQNQQQQQQHSAAAALSQIANMSQHAMMNGMTPSPEAAQFLMAQLMQQQHAAAAQQQHQQNLMMQNPNFIEALRKMSDMTRTA